LPRQPLPCDRDPDLGLPIPPRRLWAHYGENAAHYLELGKTHVGVMRKLAAEAGGPLETARRILELGCSAGRMLRWLHDLVPAREIWGVDITADHIDWCKQYLSPPFHFAVTSVHPHLPFEDHYFSFVYAGSVLTHLTDSADAWLLELRRVVCPGGRLYITIHDRHTMEILDRSRYPLADLLRTQPDYQRLRTSDFETLTVSGESWDSCFVFHDVSCLSRRLAPFFRVLSATEEAYSYQTALLLERR
jgi:SAM-dependent methyltransferase